MGMVCGKQKMRQRTLDNMKFDSLYQHKAADTPLRVRSRKGPRASADLSLATITSYEDIEKIYEIEPDIIGKLMRVSFDLNPSITRSRTFR